VLHTSILLILLKDTFAPIDFSFKIPFHFVSSFIMRIQLTCFILIRTTPLASSFIHNMFQEQNLEGRPELPQITDKQTDAQFNILLDIGKEDETHLAIQGMVLELHHEPANDVVKRVLLPGSDGPHSQISSGPRRLDVLSEGTYVDIAGTQHVHALSPCWEMVWLKNKPAGSLICGFELPQDYKRNAAILPKGDLFFSFPIWTQAGLLLGQAEKRRVQEEHAQVLAELEEHLVKRDTTSNPIRKAIHSCNAFCATEKLNFFLPDEKGLESIPDFLEEIIKLQDDLFLVTTGKVWCKNGEFGTDVNHHFLGQAHIAT
jgi:hypothetical protein